MYLNNIFNTRLRVKKIIDYSKLTDERIMSSYHCRFKETTQLSHYLNKKRGMPYDLCYKRYPWRLSLLL